jgi:hypothetical protein
VECPEGATRLREDGPCSCEVPGFLGEIEWDRAAGAHLGKCVLAPFLPFTDVARRLKPSRAFLDHPDGLLSPDGRVKATCTAGTLETERVQWGPGVGWVGKCTPVKCPEQVPTTRGSTWTPRTGSDAGRTPVFHDATPLERTILRRMKTVGCKCPEGYQGYAPWRKAEVLLPDASWNFDACWKRKVLCPVGALWHTHPVCQCQLDREGKVRWSFSRDDFVGTCDFIKSNHNTKHSRYRYEFPKQSQPRAEQFSAASRSESFCSKCETAYRNVGAPISRTTSADDIRKAFKRASLKIHPDRNGDKTGTEKARLEELFKVVNNCHKYTDQHQVEKSYYDCCVDGSKVCKE